MGWLGVARLAGLRADADTIVGHNHTIDDKRVEVKIAVPKESISNNTKYAPMHASVVGAAVGRALTRCLPHALCSTRDFSAAQADTHDASGSAARPQASGHAWTARSSRSDTEDNRFRDLRGHRYSRQSRGSSGNMSGVHRGFEGGYSRRDSYRSADSFRSEDSQDDSRGFDGFRRGTSYVPGCEFELAHGRGC